MQYLNVKKITKELHEMGKHELAIKTQKYFEYDRQTIQELNAYYDWLEKATGEQHDLPEDWN